MADPFSTVAAVVSVADVMIRTCNGLSTLVFGLKDAPQAAQHLRQTVQNVQSVLESLRLYVSEYESSNLFIEQRQILPDIVKNEILEIRAELDLLQKLLPPSGTQGKISQRMKWVFDEKQVSKGVRRLESRQIILMTGLQCLAQRNGLKIYDKLSNVRDGVQQTQSSINQRLDEVARVESENLATQMSTLNGIQMLAENIPNNHTTTMNKLDQLGSMLASMRMSEGHIRSNTTLQAPTEDALRRILRAELKRVVLPTVEDYLDSYKSNHDLQLEGIRRNLDQIVIDLGRSSQDEAVTKHTNGFQESIMSTGDFKSQDDDPLPRESTNQNTDLIYSGIDSRTLSDSGAVGNWSRSWSRSWIFRWRIGVLIVTISASHPRSRSRRRDCQAFNMPKPSSARHSYRVSLDLQPAPSLWVRRGMSMVCESQQDQRGYYQVCPMITTFAIIPEDSEVFSLCIARDIPGLQDLFEARLAAPTDRDPDSFSLLHLASGMGYHDVYQFLLREGADPFAVDKNGVNCLLAVQFGMLKQFFLPARVSEATDSYSITRNLIRAGLDLNDVFLDLLHFILFDIRQQGKPIWEYPQNFLLDLRSFLCDQGLTVDRPSSRGVTLLMANQILPKAGISNFEEAIRERTDKVFLLCLLKADVSFREATMGMQALHFLFFNEWSAEVSPHFINLAYILIRFGGADVHALDYKNNSPTLLALRRGWMKEWLIVLDRCGFDLDEVRDREIAFYRKIQFLGDGESTAVDTADVVFQNTGAVARRRGVVGDRLDD